MNIFIIAPILAGLLAGWFINYLADVLPRTRRLSQPMCIYCEKPVSWKNYLLFRSCPSCEHPRSLRTWLTQIAAMAVSLTTWFLPHPRLGYWIGLVLLIYFGVVFVIDLEHRLILHPTSIVGAVLGLGVGIYLHGFVTALLGGLGGFLIMLSFYMLGTLFAKIRARRMRASGQEPDDEEALGAGDVILATILGFILGWPLIWFGLLLGILLGGVITLPMFIFVLTARRYKRDAWMIFIPYGPFFLISTTLIIYLPKLLSNLVPK